MKTRFKVEEDAPKHEDAHVAGSILDRLTHSFTLWSSTGVSIIATKRLRPRRWTLNHRRTSDQGDDRLCAVLDADKVQLQQVDFVDARQSASTRVVACRQVEGRRSDRVSRGSTGVRRHTTGYAFEDAEVSLHQAHRAIGLGGDQIPPGSCVASGGVQRRAATEGVLRNPLQGQ